VPLINSVSTIPVQSVGAAITLSVTPRSGFVAPPGYAILSVDFSSQEIYVAAVLSKDEKILQSFLEPEILPLLDAQGNQLKDKEGKDVFYKNPLADLHTITCKDCCFPHLFHNAPIHEWVKIAKDESKINLKGDPRTYAKRLNFGIFYGQTAERMADLWHVKQDATKMWLKQHQTTYHQFHSWAAEIGHLCEVRGWSRNVDGLIRWVAEDNAKAEGASPARSGVNFQIQGYSSTQIKLAQQKVFRAYRGTKARMGMLVHDELVCLVPGGLTLSTTKSEYKKGIFKPIYEPDEEAQYWTDLTCNLMQDAQTETFNGEWKGRAAAVPSIYWNH
jgi:DNA polymerase-1